MKHNVKICKIAFFCNAKILGSLKVTALFTGVQNSFYYQNGTLDIEQNLYEPKPKCIFIVLKKNAIFDYNLPFLRFF